MNVLTTNKQILAAVRSVLSDANARRVVISGFIGAGAEDLIPNPKGVEIYCWDREGGTNPEAIGALLRKGAKVFFVSNLHAKVYWASGRGCVIGSANLSKNGLGNAGLWEVAVQMPARSFSMTSYLKALKAKPVTGEVLDAFELRCRLYRGRNAIKDICDSVKKRKVASYPVLNFAGWMESEIRTDWRLEVSSVNFTDEEEKLLVRHGNLDPAMLDDLEYWSGSRGLTTPGKWVLFVDVEKNNKLDVGWCCPQTQTPSSKLPDEVREGSAPFFATQSAKNRELGPDPFKVDKAFKVAVKKFLIKHDALTYDTALELAPDGKVSKHHLNEILTLYKSSK